MSDADLNPTLNVRPLPSEVQRLREAAAALNARHEAVAGPRIAAHLETCQEAHAELARYHAGVADRLDLDVRGRTRPAALWALSGRCLGLLRAVLMQVQAGVTCEALVTGRALHEALQLLLATTRPTEEDDEVLRKWLADEDKRGYVSAAQAREANARLLGRLRGIIVDADEDDVVPDMPGVAANLYDKLSRAGHNRRQAVLEAVSEPLRRMTVGYDPDPLVRALYTSWATTMTAEVVAFVGDTLNLFIQAGFAEKVVNPLHARLVELQVTEPLQADAIRRAAATA